MKLAQFEPLLAKEVNERGLVKGQVSQCIHEAYHTLSKAAHGNNGHVILRHGDRSDNHITVLVVLLKMQQQLADPISWKEVPAEEPN